MAKRKTTKKSGLFSFFSKEKKTGRRSKKNEPLISAGVKLTLTIMAATILLAGVAIGLIYMDRYIKTTLPPQQTTGPLAYYYPDWVNQQWKDSIYRKIGNGPFPLNEHAARQLAEQLEAISWLTHVRAQVKPDYIEIQAEYHKPVGLVELSRGRKYYLDSQMVVLDYLPIDTLTVIPITGIASLEAIPSPGLSWQAEDAAAAVQLLDYLYRCDMYYLKEELIKKPLMDEIASINVANFAARKSNSANRPHIYLKAADGTQIQWGAAIGQGDRYVEARAEKKRERLYQHFIDNNNSLQGTAKYIELRNL